VYDEVIESPAFKPGYVAFRGKLMRHNLAARINEYRPHLRALADEGLCIAHAAKRLGWSIHTVIRWADVLGIQFKKPRRRRVYRYDKAAWREAILVGASRGLTLEKVAMGLDVPLMNIHRYCHDHGINWKQLKQDAKENR
jgi:hypothetical protein